MNVSIYDNLRKSELFFLSTDHGDSGRISLGSALLSSRLFQIMRYQYCLYQRLPQCPQISRATYSRAISTMNRCFVGDEETYCSIFPYLGQSAINYSVYEREIDLVHLYELMNFPAISSNSDKLVLSLKRRTPIAKHGNRLYSLRKLTFLFGAFLEAGIVQFSSGSVIQSSTGHSDPEIDEIDDPFVDHKSEKEFGKIFEEFDSVDEIGPWLAWLYEDLPSELFRVKNGRVAELVPSEKRDRLIREANERNSLLAPATRDITGESGTNDIADDQKRLIPFRRELFRVLIQPTFETPVPFLERKLHQSARLKTSTAMLSTIYKLTEQKDEARPVPRQSLLIADVLFAELLQPISDLITVVEVEMGCLVIYIKSPGSLSSRAFFIKYDGTVLFIKSCTNQFDANSCKVMPFPAVFNFVKHKLQTPKGTVECIRDIVQDIRSVSPGDYVSYINEYVKGGDFLSRGDMCQRS